MLHEIKATYKDKNLDNIENVIQNVRLKDTLVLSVPRVFVDIVGNCEF